VRYLVTGATGFIGTHFVSSLSTTRVDLSLLVRNSSEIGPDLRRLATIETYDGTLDSITSIITEVRPDLVVHLASYFVAEHKRSDIDSIVESNIRFGLNLLEAMKALDHPRIINIGTSWQHFNNASYDPVCLYAASKQAFEDILTFYVNAENFRAITLKLFDTYGPSDHRRKLIPLLIKALSPEHRLLLSPGEQQIDLVHIDDVVRALNTACERIMQAGTGHESFALSSGTTVSLRQLVNIFAQATGTAPFVEWGARPYRQREVMVPWSTAVRLPGWSPTVDLQNGLAGCVSQRV